MKRMCVPSSSAYRVLEGAAPALAYRGQGSTISSFPVRSTAIFRRFAQFAYVPEVLCAGHD